MSDNPTTESNGTGDNSSANSTPTVTPVTTPAVSPTPAASTAQPIDLAPLMTALSALPETIAKSVKEAIGTPAPANTPAAKSEEKPKAETTEEKPKANPTGTPGKKTFAERWFG